jgi:ureidoacrylate peracid hydrolase
MPTLTLPARYFRLYPPERFLGHATRQFEVDTTQAALLLVDVYGRGFDPEGGDPSSWSGLVSDQSADREADIVCRHIRPAVDAARSLGLPVVYAANSAPAIGLERSAYEEMKRDTLQFDTATMYAEQGIDPREYHAGASDILQYSEIIAPGPDDYFIRKHTHSAFFDTRLDTLLRNLGIRTLICAGFALDVCLGNTMMDAVWRNYRCLLLRDCTYAIEIPGIDEPGKWTERWITYVESCIGYTLTSAEFIAECARARPAG